VFHELFVVFADMGHRSFVIFVTKVTKKVNITVWEGKCSPQQLCLFSSPLNVSLSITLGGYKILQNGVPDTDL